MDGQPQVHVRRIVDLVAAEYGLESSAVLGASRLGSVREARLICYWLSRRTTRLSFPELGTAFHRDHSSVQQGFRAVERRRRSMPFILQTTDRLLGLIQREKTL